MKCWLQPKLMLIVGISVVNLKFSYSQNVITLFSLNNYSQKVEQWLNPQAANYESLLLPASQQQQRFNEFMHHYFPLDQTAKSPWNKEYVIQVLQGINPHENLFNLEQKILTQFSNNVTTSPIKIGYGSNFRPYLPAWNVAIAVNVDLSQFKNLKYNPAKRAIAIKNSQGRLLPTIEPFYYNANLAGEGYPFDNLQQSGLAAGSPLYILATTRDNAWSLVLTPDVVEWVPSDGIAITSDNFVAQWTAQAQKQLAAITQPTAISDTEHVYRFDAYIGNIFPLRKNNGSQSQILVPVAGENGAAVIKYANLDATQITRMPLALTPHNLAQILLQLQGRSYGWGNLYNYNDCSAELKALFTPFAIYLPRNSSQQIYAGKMVDLSSSSALEREQYLLKYGKPWLTLVRIPGHVLLYMGKYPNPLSNQHELIAMSYQDIWGLRPADNSYRSIIGQAVFFPLLQSYPESPNLISFYNAEQRKTFQLVFLDELPSTTSSNLDFILKY